MSMPNRFCVIERRLDIIEEKLGIENSVEELNKQVHDVNVLEGETDE